MSDLIPFDYNQHFIDVFGIIIEKNIITTTQWIKGLKKTGITLDCNVCSDKKETTTKKIK